jgi:uncharacterized protein (TIGR03067 family)
MGRTMLATAALLALSAPVWAADKDTSKLIGTWRVAAAEKDGKAQTATDVKGRQVKITRDTITCYDRDNRVEMACTYSVDTAKTPWQVELTCTQGEHKGKKLRGILSLDGDTLKVCHAKPDKAPPTSFKGSEGQCCLTLERARR